MKLAKKFFSSEMVLYEPNTFIGGVGGTINTAELMAAKIVNGSKYWIKNFKVDEFNNVSFYIGRGYEFISEAFKDNQQIKYIIDLDGRWVNDAIGDRDINPSSCFQDSSLQYIRSNSRLDFGNNMFQNTKLKLSFFPKANKIGRYRHYGNINTFKRLYSAKMTNGTNVGGTNQPFGGSDLIGTIVYAPLGWEASGDAGVINYFTYARDNGATIIEVTNFTPPNPITDLTVTPTTTTVTVNFTTPPPSVNAIDFYEIWIEKGKMVNSTFVSDNNPVQKFLPNDFEITASGQTLTGLEVGTWYKIRLATVDVLYNGSGMSDTPSFSNEIIFKTL